MEAELREGMQAWRKLHPKASLDEIESELNRQVAALLGVAVSEPTARRVGETVGAAYVALQNEQTAELERCAPPAMGGSAVASAA